MVLDLTPSYIAATSDVTTCSVSVVGANYEAGLISFALIALTSYTYIFLHCCNFCDNMFSFTALVAMVGANSSGEAGLIRFALTALTVCGLEIIATTPG